jgi:hypothetical protein
MLIGWPDPSCTSACITGTWRLAAPERDRKAPSYLDETPGNVAAALGVAVERSSIIEKTRTDMGELAVREAVTVHVTTRVPSA